MNRHFSNLVNNSKKKARTNRAIQKSSLLESEMSDHKVYFAPMMANDLGLGFTDKRNRNPNWTDHEIIRFLEILQDDQVLKDLAANRNKQVSV